MPGWLVAGAIAGVLVVGTGWPWWIVPAAIGVLAARDMALYPAMRATFRPPVPTQPIGRRGVAVERCARSASCASMASCGARAVGSDVHEHDHVVVTGARGLTTVALLAEPRLSGEDVRDIRVEPTVGTSSCAGRPR